MPWEMLVKGGDIPDRQCSICNNLANITAVRRLGETATSNAWCEVDAAMHHRANQHELCPWIINDRMVFTHHVCATYLNLKRRSIKHIGNFPKQNPLIRSTTRSACCDNGAQSPLNRSSKLLAWTQNSSRFQEAPPRTKGTG